MEAAAAAIARARDMGDGVAPLVLLARRVPGMRGADTGDDIDGDKTGSKEADGNRDKDTDDGDATGAGSNSERVAPAAE